MYTKTVILLNSDNFDNALLSFEAYRAAVLEMSTGDFGCHEYSIVWVLDNQPVIVGFDELDGSPIFDVA